MKEKHGVIKDNTLGTLSSLRAVIMMKVSGKDGDWRIVSRKRYVS